MKYKLFPCILCITLFSCHFQKKENTSAVKAEFNLQMQQNSD